jgi:hypothetical protein
MMLRFAGYVEWSDAVGTFAARRGLPRSDVEALFGGNAIRSLPRLAARLRASVPVRPTSAGERP